jgi:hypothetical protein
MKTYMPRTMKLAICITDSERLANYSMMYGGRGANYRMAAVIVMLVPIAAGCGSRFDTAPVSGEVKLNGKTFSGIAVAFEPVPDGVPVSTGVTDAGGRYTLRTVGGKREEGALIGKHRIKFRYVDPGITAEMSYEQANAVMLKNGTLLPPAARDGSMEFEVPKTGTATADFQLNSPSR